jgi:hypothetical protein
MHTALNRFMIEARVEDLRRCAPNGGERAKKMAESQTGPRRRRNWWLVGRLSTRTAV